MPAIPESTRSSIILRLLDHAEHNWPQLAKVQARYHGSFAYITGVLPGGEQIRYSGSATAARPAPSASRSTHPPATAMKTLSCSPDCPSAARKKPSTPPAPSTSQRPDTNPTPDPRRTYGVAHLRGRGIGTAMAQAMILVGSPVIPGVGEMTITPTPSSSAAPPGTLQVTACDLRR